MGRERLCVLSLALTLWLGAAAGSPSLAAKWRFEPRISANVTYTDNVDLDADQKRSDAVFRVEPGIVVTAKGDRLKLEAAYSGSFLAFINEDRTDWRNNLRSTFVIEPVENHFFISGSAVIAEPFVDQTNSVTFSSDNITRNRRQVMSFSVSPYLRHRLGNIADVEWRGRWNLFRIEDPEPDDPTPNYIANYGSYAGMVTVDSGDRLGRLHWSLEGSYEKRDRHGFGIDSSETIVRARSEYRVLRWLGVVGAVGWQRANDPNLFREIDGFIWDAGLRINPSRNTDLTVTYGKEDDDRRFRARGEYRIKRLTLGFTYNNEITQSARLYGEIVSAGEFGTGSVFLDEFGGFLDPNDVVFGFRNEVYRSERFMFEAIYKLKRTRIDLKAAYEERSFGLSTDPMGTEKTHEIDLRGHISHELSQHLRADADLRFRRTDFDRGQSRVDNFYGIRAALIYEFSEILTGSVSYTFSVLDSNIGNEDRTENVITAWLRANF